METEEFISDLCSKLSLLICFGYVTKLIYKIKARGLRGHCWKRSWEKVLQENIHGEFGVNDFDMILEHHGLIQFFSRKLIRFLGVD